MIAAPAALSAWPLSVWVVDPEPAGVATVLT